jgi:GAF domain-containing protein
MGGRCVARDRLRQQLAFAAPGDPPLTQLCRAAPELTGVSGAAVILMSAGESGAIVEVSDPDTAAVEDLHFVLGEGPCLEAYDTDRPVLVPDLAADDRWPEFAREAVRLGARAAFAVPLRLGAIRLGALWLYRDRPGPLTDDQTVVVLDLADLATNLVLDLQLGAPADALGPVLDGNWTHRAVVHAATGMVAAQLATTLGDALARIRAHAFADGASIYAVAVEIVERRLRLEPI